MQKNNRFSICLDREATSKRLDGMEIQVNLKKSARSRRMTLRVPQQLKACGAPTVFLTVPLGTTKSEAEWFVKDQENWLIEKLSNLPRMVKFEDGSHVPYLGVLHKIIHEPNARRGVWRHSLSIHVSGRAEFLSRRLISWFKVQAKRLITERIESKAEILKVGFGKITIRDTRSRWGSCSSLGNLSFSWRLVMAPDLVIDYITAHEIAHIIEANHGPKFWELTQGLCPEMHRAKNWLKENGNSLHCYY